MSKVSFLTLLVAVYIKSLMGFRLLYPKFVAVHFRILMGFILLYSNLVAVLTQFIQVRFSNWQSWIEFTISPKKQVSLHPQNEGGLDKEPSCLKFPFLVLEENSDI